jgi:2-desacetyl-2-hydroxyethyl bacteriochlorophyllide A dehydrogenase
MRAIEFTTENLARVVHREVPVPGPGEVRVRITSAGICGSDLTALRGVHPFRIPPLISGHEGGGRVVEVHPGLPATWLGRQVAIEPQRACQGCDACAAGLPHLCRNRVMLGMAAWPGTLAEYVTVPVECLHPVDWSVAEELLALAEPLAVGHHALSMAPPLERSHVAVLGGGPIGALLVHLAVQAGAEAVVATDPRPPSRRACARLGASATADPREACWRDTVADGHGFDVVFVATAAPGVLDDAAALLRPRGVAVEVGLFSGPVEFDVTALQQGEKTLVGSNVYTAADFDEAVGTLQRSASRLAALANDHGGLDRAVEYLNAKAAGRADDIIKLLIHPSEHTADPHEHA